MRFFSTLVIILLVITKINVIRSHPMLEQKIISSSKNLTKYYEINNIGTIIGNCLADKEITRCFKQKIIEKLENAIKDNETWQLNDYIILEKDPDWKPTNNNITDINDFNEVLEKKFEDFAESRSLRFKIGSKSEEQGTELKT